MKKDFEKSDIEISINEKIDGIEEYSNESIKLSSFISDLSKDNVVKFKLNILDKYLTNNG